jgi:hypothetical protein
MEPIKYYGEKCAKIFCVFHHLQMLPVQMAGPVPYVPLYNRPNNGLCEFFPTNSMVYIVAFQSPES